jgi:hypothetical protein
MGFNRHYLEALNDAQESTKRLWRDVTPLPTNLWAIKSVKFEPTVDGYGIYTPKRTADNGVLEAFLRGFIGRMEPGKLRTWHENMWLDSIKTFRNWYYEDVLKHRFKDLGIKWFLWGTAPPDGFFQELVAFWERYVDANYRPLNVEEIPCPDNTASSGFVYTTEGWQYKSDTGDIWNSIVDASWEIGEYLQRFAPSWKELFKPDYTNAPLEKISINQPVVRLESGPLGVRLAMNQGKHLYLRGRRIIQRQQESFSEDELHYIGKASHCSTIGEVLDDYRGPAHIATHGDDWICVLNGQKLSGDWSKFDLHTSALQELLSRKAQYQVLARFLSEEDLAELRSLAYLNTRRRISWPWAMINGRLTRYVSPRRIVGHVDSGGSDFVMHNNARNQAALKVIFRRHPKRSFKGWKWFSSVSARHFGWVAKPSAQKIARTGFIACRTLFDQEFGFRPIPCVGSVIRNWLRVSYDPLEFPQNWRVALATRFVALDEALSLLPHDEWADTMGAVIDAATAAGVDDPSGAEISASERGYWMEKLHGEYSYRTFLES